MISPNDLRTYVIGPVCDRLELGGDAVEELLLGTAMQESGCGKYLHQRGGPALGVWQMEPATHDDIWLNFLKFRAPLAGAIAGFIFSGLPQSHQLIGNLYYACAMARMQYFRSPLKVPKAGDLEGQATMYKVVFNTVLGKATPEQYVANFRTLNI